MGNGGRGHHRSGHEEVAVIIFPLIAFLCVLAITDAIRHPGSSADEQIAPMIVKVVAAVALTLDLLAWFLFALWKGAL
jgi:Kef-type K+ transport system membrane component KefB